MTADDILLDAEERMEKAIAKLKHDLTGIRTGRANPGLVDSLRVDVYGSPTPIKPLRPCNSILAAAKCAAWA